MDENREKILKKIFLKIIVITFILVVILECRQVTLNHPAEGAGGILIGMPQKGSKPVQPSIIVSGTGSTITEGKARIASLKLSAEITNDLPVTISSDNSAVTIDGSASLVITLTRSDATIDHEFILAAEVDNNLVSETATITISAPGLTGVTFKVTATDKDTQNFSLGGAVTASEGGIPGFVAVSLTKIPIDNVTVSISSGNTSAITVSPATLTFTPANYATAQLVSATAIEDSNLLADTVTLSFNATGVPTSTYDITTIDNDTAGVLSFTPASGSVSVNPDPARIVIVFAQSMDTASVPTITFTNNATAIPVSIRSKVWSKTNLNNDTLTINLSWILFPEVTQLDWTIPKTSLVTADGFALVSDIVGTFTTTTRGVTYPVSDTGQTLCYNDTTTIPCGDATYPRQDADFTKPRSFTGPLEHGTYTGNYVTIDNVTGLVWKTCEESKSGSTCAGGTQNIYTWYNAVNTCSSLNLANSGAGYYGRTNWRLPTSIEWRTLWIYTGTNPALDATYFPQLAGGGQPEWSATTVLSQQDRAWVESESSGQSSMDSTTTKITTNKALRCVSDLNNLLAISYTQLDNTMVRDNVTNLIWQRCTAGQVYDSTCSGTRIGLNWKGALAYCANLNLGGRSWRLPSLAELRSLVNQSKTNPSIDSNIFPSTYASASLLYFSSTSKGDNNSYFWGVSFTDGAIGFTTKTGSSVIRCVTDGP